MDLVYAFSVCVCVCLCYTLILRYVCQLLQCKLNLPPSSQQKDKAPLPHISPIYLCSKKLPGDSYDTNWSTGRGEDV